MFRISLPISQEKRRQQIASVRLTQVLMHQAMRLAFFAFYGLSDEIIC